MKKYILALFTATVLLCGCGKGSSDTSQVSEESSDSVFSSRDLSQTADTSSAETLELKGEDIEITKDGVYIITGQTTGASIIVNASPTDKVQLVLEGISIENESKPAIKVLSADKCFITTTEKENKLTLSDNFDASGEAAVIYSKTDLVINGLGTLNVESKTGNGISCDDDLKITGGNMNVVSFLDGIEVKDEFLLNDGNINIISQKDGIHCEKNNGEKGSLKVFNGSLDIEATKNGIRTATSAIFEDGNINIKAGEGVESTLIDIKGGNLTIEAEEDGLNAGNKSVGTTTPNIDISGGNVNISVTGEVSDAVDSNGDISISGGNINIDTAFSSFDYAGNATFTGGKLVVNGEELTEIPPSSK